MRRFQTFVRLFAAPLVAVMFMTTFNIGIARAGLVATDDVARENAASADREQVRTFLNRDDVWQEMINLGVDPDEAAARVEALSDSEVSRIAARIDRLPAGEGAVEAIVGALLLVFIILLITDVAGVTDVFDFDD